MKKIIAWVDKYSNLHYAGYKNFQRSPAEVLKKHSANCCDGTRFFFTLCDAVGLCEYFDFYYVHVQCPSYGHVYGIVETKKTKKWRYVDTASDSHGCWGYVCRGCPHGSKGAKYPNLPFQKGVLKWMNIVAMVVAIRNGIMETIPNATS